VMMPPPECGRYSGKMNSSFNQALLRRNAFV